MKPWREVTVPHPEVLGGTFQQSEFAADITAVRAVNHAELAILYDDKKSPVHDSVEAVKWYEVLAAGSSGKRPRATMALARDCRGGDVTPQAPEMAREWLRQLLQIVSEKFPAHPEAAKLLKEMQGDLL